METFLDNISDEFTLTIKRGLLDNLPRKLTITQNLSRINYEPATR